MVELNAPPPTAGEVLLEEFLKPMNMSQVQLAERVGVPVQRINTLIHGKRGVTAETAILLASAFGTSAEFWLNLQQATDLWNARKLSNVIPFRKSTTPDRRTGARERRTEGQPRAAEPAVWGYAAAGSRSGRIRHLEKSGRPGPKRSRGAKKGRRRKGA